MELSPFFLVGLRCVSRPISSRNFKSTDNISSAVLLEKTRINKAINPETIAEGATGTHATLSASDPDGQTVTYSESASVLSGAGFSLNSST